MVAKYFCPKIDEKNQLMVLNKPLRLVFTFCCAVVLPNSIWQKRIFIELVKFFIKNVQLIKKRFTFVSYSNNQNHYNIF